jgi:hypothetical protein
MVLGILVGVGLGQRLAARAGYRAPVAAGLLLAAASLAAGAATDTDTGYGFVAAWLAMAGTGVGAALAPATDAVLGTLPPERAGAGVAILYTLRQAAGRLLPPPQRHDDRRHQPRTSSAGSVRAHHGAGTAGTGRPPRRRRA